MSEIITDHSSTLFMEAGSVNQSLGRLPPPGISAGSGDWNTSPKLHSRSFNPSQARVIGFWECQAGWGS